MTAGGGIRVALDAVGLVYDNCVCVLKVEALKTSKLPLFFTSWATFEVPTSSE